MLCFRPRCLSVRLPSELRDAVEEVLPSLQQQGVRVFILSHECDLQGVESLSDKIQQASDEPLSPQLRAQTLPKTPAVYIYTSGTTGQSAGPQLLRFTRRQCSLLCYCSPAGLPKAAVIKHDRLWMATFMQYFAGVRSDDVFLLNLPLYHTAGFMIGLCGAIQNGNVYRHMLHVIYGISSYNYELE